MADILPVEKTRWRPKISDVRFLDGKTAGYSPFIASRGIKTQ
jgi:hypothetical protein